ncbi:hypothetical protein BKA65DRAFT_531394 [Rhexocercosporidium sp. MPI-PUGE-AT-0058]|nr:hypothetical protein BKA65DRAFT_531394 [Rhexocercosporidium sp. MPI-PUGE-AT-0058]
MGASDRNRKPLMDTDMEMDLAMGDSGVSGDQVVAENEAGPGAPQDEADVINADEMLARQLAREEIENAIDQRTSSKRKASVSLSDYVYADSSDDEAERPHTQFFARPGKEPIEVSWDENCSNCEIPQAAPVRAMIRRIVAKVALERGHEIAWIMKCYLRGRWIQNNPVPSTDRRFLSYVEHIEAEFGYKSDEDEILDPGVRPHESATIYFGPDDEWILENIGLWRKSGGATVVWNQDENLRLRSPRIL